MCQVYYFDIGENPKNTISKIYISDPIPSTSTQQVDNANPALASSSQQGNYGN